MIKKEIKECISVVAAVNGEEISIQNLMLIVLNNNYGEEDLG